jgi:hypothetical protein
MGRMTVEEFRKLALAQPDAEERSHMDHPDFRVRGKVIATLGYPNEEWAMVKLAPDDQLAMIASAPNAFVPVKGKWGERGATNVRLGLARTADVRKALACACALIARGKARSKASS